MKNKAKILTLLLALLSFATPFLSVANAASYDYKSTHTKTSVDGNATITKSAAWTNEEKGEAEITIKVKAKEPKQVENADIIYLIDKSSSMRKEIGLTYTGYYTNSSGKTVPYWYTTKDGTTFTRGVRSIMAHMMPYFISEDNNNRVAIASFSSRLYTYDGGYRYLHEYYGYQKGTRKADGSYDYANMVEMFDKLTKNSKSKLSTNDLRTRIYSVLNSTNSLKFYSHDDLYDVKYETKDGTSYNNKDSVIYSFSQHGDGENTNFDLGLFAAEYLLSKRTGEDKNRKAHIIFITEGQPYPNTNHYRDKYGAGTTNTAARNADYVANLYYKDIAKNIRENYGATIHAVILNHGTDDKEMWKTICGGEANLHYIKSSAEAAIAEIESIHKEIEENIKMQSYELKVTDYIETDLFDFNGSTASASCQADIGTVKIDASTGKVEWNLGSEAKYNKEYILKIKIKLNEKGQNTTSEWLNTNKKEPTDDNCTFDYGDGEVDVETPWLKKKVVEYSVTINHIDDEKNKTITSEKYGGLKKNTAWPTSGIAKDKAVQNPWGVFGIDYKYYELDTSKIEVDGKVYTLDSMPSNITINSSKIINFHYKLKPATLVKRSFLVKEVNGEVMGVDQIKEEKDTNVKKGKTISVTKPSDISYTYVGVKVYYDNAEIKTADNIYKDLNSATEIDVKIEDEHNTAYVDFVFKEENYILTIKYQDTNKKTITDGDKMKDSETIYPANTQVSPYVPDNVTINDVDYEYKERTDEQNQEDGITMDKSKEVIFRYKPQTVPLIIEYRDIVTKEKLPNVEDSVIQTEVNEEIVVEDTVKKAEQKIEDAYSFKKREDKKEHYANADGISEKTTIVFWYMRTSGEGGLPVVSYPKIESEYTLNGEQVALLGEEIKVKVPNKGTHEQMDDYGIPQPEDGWNSVYAQVKYLVCGCDVYYNGKLYKASTPIEIAKRSGDTISEESVSLRIPEWIKEGEYKIESIVGSKTGDIDSFNIGEKWNEIYDETAAKGKCEIEVVGRLYDFTITNLIEDKYWPNSLFAKDTTEYKANTLPIGQGDKQPAKYNYGISLGSTFFFNVNTIGQKNNKVSIVPQFKYVTKEGNIKDADIYVKNNGKYELINNTSSGIQTYLNNDYKKARTNLTNELTKAFNMASYKALETNKKYSMGTYSNVLIDSTQKVPYVKYFEEENITRYDENEKDQVLEAVSHWYGEYRLPSSTVVMEKGKTPGNGTEYKDGFIIVMFKITTKDSEGEEYLVYNNQVLGNQWKNENGKADGETLEIKLPKVGSQTKNSTVKITLKDGFYPVAIYGVGISTNGSYEIAGTH